MTFLNTSQTECLVETLEHSNSLLIKSLKLTYEIKFVFVIKWNNFRDTSWYAVAIRLSKMLLNGIIITCLFLKNEHWVLGRECTHTPSNTQVCHCTYY